MKLLKIGRDTFCNIILRSNAVSGLHAEMILLDNGDMLLEDKNSTNGTYIMNKRIRSGESVSVKRGDAIRFGDTELQWNMVPLPEDNSQFKAIYGIGTNFRNEIKISGNTVSRFHATLKIDRKGKAFIQDHSKNGTTINGAKIAPGINIRIKRTDVVICGGVPVDLKQYTPKSLNLLKILAPVAIAAIIIGAIFIIKNNIHQPVPIENLENATACVEGSFYVVVTIDDDPFKNIIPGWPKEWIFGEEDNHFPICKDISSDEVEPISFTGTAFFITDKGYLGTNRHIAVPWEYIDNMKAGSEEAIKQSMAKIRNELLQNSNSPITKSLLKYLKTSSSRNDLGEKIEEVKAWIVRFQNSPIKISGKLTSIKIGLKGQNVTTESELLPCHVVAHSDSIDRDVALLRLDSKKTPDDIVKNGFFDINEALVDEKQLKPQGEDLITMGYPYGFMLGLATENNTLKPTVHKISVSKDPDENKFQFQGEEISGASGSPIIDSRSHRLVGVLFGGYKVGSTFGLACNIKHLKALYDKNNNNEE
jgi:pSer/pThr/pTyr-binding forkhead associated (FHA) protein